MKIKYLQFLIRNLKFLVLKKCTLASPCSVMGPVQNTFNMAIRDANKVFDLIDIKIKNSRIFNMIFCNNPRNMLKKLENLVFWRFRWWNTVSRKIKPSEQSAYIKRKCIWMFYKVIYDMYFFMDDKVKKSFNSPDWR